ncbi:MAG: sporulation peptidase YabG [Ignavibacteriales bacterium]
MNVNVGDLVTRESHNNDIVFKVTDIKDSVATLKGVVIRLIADSPISDLNKYEKDKSEESHIEEINAKILKKRRF